jgi:hypothetical protein
MADEMGLQAEDIEFGMALEEGEPDDEYQLRQKNLGKIQHKKLTGFDRREPMVVYGLRDATIHGTDSAGTPCSLIVFRWYLHQRERGKRFKSLRIRILFATTRKADPWYHPRVRAVAPDGTYSLQETPVKVESKVTGEGSLDMGFGGPSAGLKAGFELSRAVETADRVIINGSSYSDYRDEEQGDPDRCNAVEWNLFENAAARSGLPAFFRTAVLLERRDGDEEKFTAVFSVCAEVDPFTDAMATVKKVFGIIPRDDPVIFDPTMKEKSEFNGFSENLDSVDLEDVCKFEMYKAAPGSGGGPAF